MSDFVRIMRGWTALCKANPDCGGCPLNAVDVCCVSVDERKPDDIAAFKLIMDNWLKDHPLPPTPTWIQWLRENGIVDSSEDGNVKLLPLARYPMNEEIAAKLGELKDG